MIRNQSRQGQTVVRVAPQMKFDRPAYPLPVNLSRIPIQIPLAIQIPAQISGIGGLPQCSRESRHGAAVDLAANLQALLDDAMEADLFGKMLFPRPPRVRSHLRRTLDFPLQNLRYPVNVALRHTNGKVLPVHVLIGYPVIGNNHAGAAHLHRLEQSNAPRPAPAWAEAEAGICDRLCIFLPEFRPFAGLPMVRRVRAVGGCVLHVNIASLNFKQSLPYCMSQPRTHKRGEIFLSAGIGSRADECILDEVQIEAGARIA